LLPTTGAGNGGTICCRREGVGAGESVSDYISVKILSVRDLLSGSYVFHLPWFQRAYAWHTPEVGRLLTNVVDAMQLGTTRRYFLGKIVLAKPTASAETALVDGHQRVMTLTLLYAVLRDLESDEHRRQALQGFIAAPHPLLQSQHATAEFIRRFVQDPGSTVLQPEDDMADLSETQRNIIENRDYLRTELSNGSFDELARRDLATFVADRCKVLKCAVEDEDEAWQILQTEEETRVEFTPADRAKSSLLSIVPSAERRRCQKLWEHCEALLGATDLYALLVHLRTLRLRNLSDKPVEADLARAYAMDAMGLAFIQNELVPAAELLARIRAGTIGAPAQQQAIAAAIRQASWIDPQYWIPVALNWLMRRDERDPDTAQFFPLIERLVWFMRLSGADPIKRQRHILRLLGEMDKGAGPAEMRELEIPKAVRAMALDNLRSPTFDAKHYAGRVLRRASVALGQDPGPVHAANCTLEHILPRSFLADGPWRKDFPNRKSVQSHAHRLGNLTFLTAADNQAADTFDWNAKRRILMSSNFVLSKRAGAARQWTPASITDRTEDLIAVLMKAWQLT
jgi:hypothetical protein